MPEHGTTAGYQSHKYNKEEACDACKAAQAQSTMTYYNNNPDKKKRHNMLSRAHGKAERRLKAMYPFEFEVLYLEELKKEEEAERARAGSEDR